MAAKNAKTHKEEDDFKIARFSLPFLCLFVFFAAIPRFLASALFWRFAIITVRMEKPG